MRLLSYYLILMGAPQECRAACHTEADGPAFKEDLALIRKMLGEVQETPNSLWRRPLPRATEV